MKVEFINLKPIHKNIKKDILKLISGIIDSNNFIDGYYSKKFEEAYAEFCNAKYCVTVNSGTSALHLSSKLKFKNKYVAAPGNSFFATVSSFCYEGFKPYFIDINDRHNISVDNLIKFNTKYDNIICVSLYGNPCDLLGINNISKQYDKPFIHDACQAHGSLLNNKPICNFSDLTCFSFYPSKNLGTFGEGGAIVTNNKNLYEQLNILKNHGQSTRYNHEYIGYNYRLNEIQSAALLVKLKYLNEWNDERIELANRYNENLKNNNKIQTLICNDNDKCVYHLYPIFTKYKKELIDLLQKHEIGYGFHYPKPIYDQEPFKKYKHKNLSNTELYKDIQISLPLYVGMNKKHIDYVCEVINKL